MSVMRDRNKLYDKRCIVLEILEGYRLDPYV